MQTEETLHGDINARLRPWLALVALVPTEDAYPLPSPEQADVPLMESIFERGRSIAAEIGLFPGKIRDEKNPGDDVNPFGRYSVSPHDPIYRGTAVRIFYGLLVNVRFTLRTIANQSQAHLLLSETERPEDRADALWQRSATVWQNGRFSWSLPAGAAHKITVERGYVEIEDNLGWAKFKMAMRGVEANRVRLCPECGHVYYAIRNNKMACDQHLALVAVKRSQKKAKAKAGLYKENKRKYKKLRINAKATRSLHRALRRGLPDRGRKDSEPSI